MKKPLTPEFSRPVLAESLPDEGETFDIEADALERQALAKRFGLLSLEALTARILLTPTAGGGVSAKCNLAAQLTQSCVVSLKPVESRVEATFERLYGHRTEPATSAGIDIEPLAEEEDFPEPLGAGAIDLGEAAAEQLALELDQFPRLKDAAFAGYSSGGKSAAAAGVEGSFAVLAKLKKKSSIK